MENNKFMEKLLDGVEVEWKPLGEIAEVKNGYTPSKKRHDFWENGNIPWFRLEDIRKEGRILNKSIQYVTDKAVKSGKLFPSNSIIISTTATIGEHALVDTEFLCNQQLTVLSIKEQYKTIIIPKFLFYYGFILGELFKKDTNPNGFALIGTKKIKTYSIPIPSIKSQKEIVHILDNFTELTTELTTELSTELTARKKQYEYYRDELLTFEGKEIEWKRLNDVGELVRGSGLPKKEFTETGIPAIHYGQIYTYYNTYTYETISFVSPKYAEKLKSVDTGDVVITNTSENIEGVGKALVYLGEKQAVTGGHATVFKPFKNILGKYIAYFTQTINFSKQKRKYAKGTKVFDVSPGDMGKILIPIPFPNDPKKSLDEQQRIVSILDKFETLTTSITDGLPKEIELRQKQYEYYRDMLFNFPKELN